MIRHPYFIVGLAAFLFGALAGIALEAKDHSDCTINYPPTTTEVTA